MDLKNFVPKEDTVTVTIAYDDVVIKNDDDGSDMTITVYLPHSKEAKKIQHEFTNRQLKKMSSGKKKLELTSEDLEEISLESLARLTVDWNITYDGERPKLTVEKAKEIYSEVFWIKLLVEGATSEAMDFTKA